MSDFFKNKVCYFQRSSDGKEQESRKKMFCNRTKHSPSLEALTLETRFLRYR